MRFTYAAAENETTNGVSLGAAGEDIRVYKVLIGLPVAAGVITLFNKAISVGGATSDVAFKYTLGADIAPEDIDYIYERIIDFGPHGLPLDGGNLQVDQAMQVTVIWDFAPKG